MCFHLNLEYFFKIEFLSSGDTISSESMAKTQSVLKYDCATWR
ncbi:hypothetical protein JCM19232_2219 [Vibrio ishigakensis]|uniref:Uncharacterized protein n=1 Tax=Vibrio ishigakensis TaxID=1481914 RepID=A0A0B8PM99_9VIBR|nr:hypothetical protein JCM19232_2219 [Vibrio ishigakensis]